MLAALATAEDGDAILLPDPGYPDYLSGAALAGRPGARRCGSTRPTHFQPDFDAAPQRRLASRSPSSTTPPTRPPRSSAPAPSRPPSPTRTTSGAWVLNDLAYGFLAYDGARARSILEVDGARDVAIELWSPSKIYGMAGWRIGFAVGSPDADRAHQEPRRPHDRRRLGRPPARADRGADLRPGRRRRAPRDLRRAAATSIVRALTDAGIAARAGRGLVLRLVAAARRASRPESLIAEQRVGVAPGQGFGASGQGYARLSLALADEDVALRRARGWRVPAT